MAVSAQMLTLITLIRTNKINEHSQIARTRGEHTFYDHGSNATAILYCQKYSLSSYKNKYIIRLPPSLLGKVLDTTQLQWPCILFLDHKSEPITGFTRILTGSTIKVHFNFVDAWPLFHYFQAAKETGALQAAKSKLEKEVEELTWRLQLEKRIRVNTLTIPLFSDYLVFNETRRRKMNRHQEQNLADIASKVCTLPWLTLLICRGLLCIS
jgi:hypothetical protein